MGAKPTSRCFYDRPCAAAGLTSYRYPSGYSGWIMIGARDDDDALNEANRSLTRTTAERSRLEVWDGQLDKYVPVSAQTQSNPEDGARSFLSGREIRAVAKSVLAEFPGLRMGPYSYWRKEDGSFSYEVDRPHSTRAITFGWVVAGDFYAVPMEDEYRGQAWEIRNVTSKERLAAFLRDVVLEEAEWLGVQASGQRSANSGMKRLSAKASRKHNLVAIPPRSGS